MTSEELLALAADARKAIHEPGSAVPINIVDVFAERCDVRFDLTAHADDDLGAIVRNLTHDLQADGVCSILLCASVGADDLGDLAVRWEGRFHEHPNAKDQLVMVVEHRDLPEPLCWVADVAGDVHSDTVQRRDIGEWREDPNSITLHLGRVLCRCGNVEKTS